MKRVLVILVVGVVLFGTSAQRAEAQSTNIAQRIVGTWVDDRGRTWVFNANGTCATKGLRTADEKYGVTDTKLAISDSDYGTEDVYTIIYDISMSSDGKTLIMKWSYIKSGDGRTSVLLNAYTIEYWLTKK